MTIFKVHKVLALPGVPEPNSIYYVASSGSFLDIYVTGNSPSTIRRVPLLSDIQVTIDQSLAGYATDADVVTAIDAALAAYSQLEVVADIPARNALAPTINMVVFVQDATGDITVISGAATYLYDTIGSVWYKIATTGQSAVDWTSITGRPVSSPNAIDVAVADAHVHTNIAILNQIDANWDTPLFVAVAETVLPGQVVRPSNASTLVLAQADSTNNTRGAMIAATGATMGFTAKVANRYLTLSDWSSVIGSVSLTPSVDYFLSPTIPGHLTASVPNIPGQVVKHMGTAINTTTMSIIDDDEITL